MNAVTNTKILLGLNLDNKKNPTKLEFIRNKRNRQTNNVECSKNGFFFLFRLSGGKFKPRKFTFEWFLCKFFILVFYTMKMRQKSQRINQLGKVRSQLFAT